MKLNSQVLQAGFLELREREIKEEKEREREKKREINRKKIREEKGKEMEGGPQPYKEMQVKENQVFVLKYIFHISIMQLL